MKKQLYILMSMILCFIIAGCERNEFPQPAPVGTVTNLTYSVIRSNVTLSWELPADTAVSGILVYLNNEKKVDEDSIFTTYTFQNVRKNTELAYTVKVKYSNGRVSEGQTVYLTISGEDAKVAYLLDCESIEQLTDDDEIAAAQWFKNTFPTGEFLTAERWAELSAEKYGAIWLHIDRTDMGAGVNNLPANYIREDNIEHVTRYLQSGGNILLTKHATQLITAYGRTTYAPGIYGDGAGGEGTDIWTMNAVIGSGQELKYDRRGHAIFSGLDKGTFNDYPHESYPMEGPGLREDHNCMWDLNACGFTLTESAPNVVAAFEQEVNATVLATWGHVQDYCCAGIVEFLPNNTYNGRVMAIGLATYEWNQNIEGGNIYQSNTEKLTKNCLDYLCK